MLSMAGYKSNKLADCPFILNQCWALISQLQGLYVKLKEFDIYLSLFIRFYFYQGCSSQFCPKSQNMFSLNIYNKK